MSRSVLPAMAAGCSLLYLAGFGANAWGDDDFARKPEFVRGDIVHYQFDGVTDDLLTAGLGALGLANPAPPAFADPANPTALELRRNAIHGNYRALVDTVPGGGYLTLFGPNVDVRGVATDGAGRIAGDEYLAYALGGGSPVTLMVQVPAHFDPARPCIVTAPSSGSRGIYGAIGTAGEWGLKRGCAVAYTDKGTGTGAHNLASDQVNLIDGTRTDADVAGRDSHFTAGLSDPARQRYNARFPNRYAFKHAHSQRNPEQDWGRSVLQSIRFAFHVLNRQFGSTQGRHGGSVSFTPDNTLVIASSVSNGGGASLLAAEQDQDGLIDGVAVSEPNVNPEFDPAIRIRQGDGPLFAGHSRSLFDYTTLLNVYQGCAGLSQVGAPLNFASSAARCQGLHDLGMLQSVELDAQAEEAQAIINAYGILPEQNLVQPSHWLLNVSQGIAVTYANAYGRIPVVENLCGYSFAATDPLTGSPAALNPLAEAALFATSNGIPPTGGVNLVANAAVNGPINDRLAISALTGLADQNLQGALCLRSLAIGRDAVSGERLRGDMKRWSQRIAQGIRRIRANGDLNARPVVIVTGRDDAILPPNHTSRAYVALNRQVESSRSGVRYYEITNAQHLDVLNGLAGFDRRFIPLHHYFIRALDLIYAHLTEGDHLPPSQVVRTTPRGVLADGSVPALSRANLPEIASAPATDARIRFEAQTLIIPD